MNGTDVTATVIDTDTAYVAEYNYYVRIQAGSESASPYQITFKAVTSLGNHWQVDGQIVIKEV